jgi:hypothetical protein
VEFLQRSHFPQEIRYDDADVRPSDSNSHQLPQPRIDVRRLPRGDGARSPSATRPFCCKSLTIVPT